jgi:hypothetical protein
MDKEAISWAYSKLLAFGVGANNMESAMMLDRLNAALAAAPTPPAQEDELRKSAEDIIFHFDLFCRESACFGSVERIEKLRAALEKK